MTRAQKRYLPGPWYVIKPDQNGRLVVACASGDVAEILSPKFAEETASFIADAPEMHKELEEYEEILLRYREGELSTFELCEELIEVFEIREAFAKAGGSNT